MTGKIKIPTLLLFNICISYFSHSQDLNDEYVAIEYLTDNNAFREIIEEHGQEVYDLILSPNKSKTDINDITVEELRTNFFLSESQVQNFIAYRNKYGPFRSIYELQVVEGFDREVISLFLLSVSSFGKLSLDEEKKAIKQTLYLGSQFLVQKKKGFFDEKKFKGDRFKVFARYSMNYKNKIQIGFAGEKDQGEYFSFDPKKNKFLFDHHSAYIKLNRIAKRLNVIVGDFNLQSGQGLVFSQPFSIGKNVETINAVKKASPRIRPVSTSYEFKSFSGVSTELTLRNLSVSAFASYVKRDATVWQSDEENIPYIRSFDQSGLHRTELEINKENNVSETAFGTNIDYANERKIINAGLNVLYSRFSLPFDSPETPANKYKFRGLGNLITSSYFNAYLKNTHLFGEMALSNFKGLGIVSGLIHQVSPSVFLSALYRNISSNFHSFHGNIFAESSTFANEKGLYLGLKLYPFKNTTISVYHDVFTFPEVKSTVSKPTHGTEWMAFLRYNKFKSFSINLKTSYLNFEEAQNSETLAFNPVVFKQKMRIGLFGRIYAAEHLELTQQIKWSKILGNDETTSGFLISTGLRFYQQKFNAIASFNLFQTDDFNNRLYQYQSSIPHGYLYPFFYEMGSSVNLLLKIHLLKEIQLWANFHQVLFQNAENMGSNDDLIEGNRRSIVSLEIKINF